MWNLVAEQFNNYVGTGLIVIYYLAAVIYLWITEKNKSIRLLLLYAPLSVLVVFFNPWIAKLIVKFADEDIYYRLMWLVPVCITLSYAFVKLIRLFEGKKRNFAIVAAVFLIIIGGRLVYTDKDYSVAENEYHLPQEVVDICNTIIVPGREVMAAFPSDMLIFVRQYSAFVCMPYGWDEIKERPDYELTKLRKLIDAEMVDASELANEGQMLGCHYLIVNSDHVINGSMSDYSFEKYAEVDGYTVYRNLLANFDVG